MPSLTIAALSRLRRWLRYRRNLNALSRLDDRTLRDIGLNRSGVRRAAMTGSAY
jgi:uncharacterized protein YjiS (DUF1127 family)